MKVIISAGGTGGHIYPALAIIDAIKKEEPDSKFLYVGTHNRMENDIVPKRGIPFTNIEVYGFSKNIKRNIKTLTCFFKGIKKCKKIIKDFNPDIVIGVGGYVTGPLLYAANKLGYKTAIHEQNSIPGKANKFLSRYANLIMVSFKSSMKDFPSDKTIFTGNPCSSNARNIEACNKKDFGLHDDKKLVLFVMGSLGASKVNEVLNEAMYKFSNKNYEILFVTGNKDYNEISKNKYSSNVKVVPYIENLTRVMKKTDLIVSRAGASTLSEIIALRLPSILIPSPYVPNNHQFINAMDIVSNKAGLLLEEKDLSVDSLINMIDNVIDDKDKLNQMKENLSLLDIKDSDKVIYNNIKKLIDRK